MLSMRQQVGRGVGATIISGTFDEWGEVGASWVMIVLFVFRKEVLAVVMLSPKACQPNQLKGSFLYSSFVLVVLSEVPVTARSFGRVCALAGLAPQ